MNKKKLLLITFINLMFLLRFTSIYAYQENYNYFEKDNLSELKRVTDIYAKDKNSRERVKVVVIDTHFNDNILSKWGTYKRIDLNTKELPQEDSRHGDSVAEIILKYSPENTDITLISLYDEKATIPINMLSKAFEEALRVSPDIIVTSLSYKYTTIIDSDEEYRIERSKTVEISKEIKRRGIVLVGVSGNHSQDTVSFPASECEMLVVSSNNPEGTEKSSFANRGKIDISTSGEEIFSEATGIKEKGTSYSAAITAATLANIALYHKINDFYFNLEEAKYFLNETATFSKISGTLDSGILNFNNIIDIIKEGGNFSVS